MPDAVHELVHKERVNVLIQNCERRVFPADEFVKVRGTRLAEPVATLAHPVGFLYRLALKFATASRLRTSFLVSRRYHCRNSWILLFHYWTREAPRAMFNVPISHTTKG
jgi:hypothetical protein